MLAGLVGCSETSDRDQHGRLLGLGNASTAYRPLSVSMHRPSAGAAKPGKTVLENGRVRAAVDLWLLYFETGHWRADFLTERMTGSGRIGPTNCAGSSPQNCRSPARPGKIFERDLKDLKDSNWPEV
jgi:hypothetical protein